MKKILPLLLFGLAAITTNCKKKGCTDSLAENYDAKAKKDDSSCTYLAENTWYLDLDGDGLGDPNTTVTDTNTTPPVGYVDNSDDKVDAAPSDAQVPIIMKITGETCYYCGEWGWPAWVDLSNNFKGQAFAWSNYGSGFSSGKFKNEEVNPTMEKIQNMFYKNGGKPSFMANGNDYGQSDASASNKANSSLSETADVGATFVASIDGDLLTIDAEAHFFNDLTGDYYMAAYVIEDKAKGPQSGPNGGSNVEHHLVMRGSLDEDAWGQALDTGSGVQSKSYSVELPAKYKRENLYYGIVVWKKNGNKYIYVNAATNWK